MAGCRPYSSNWCRLPGQHPVLVSGNWPLAQNQEEVFVFHVLSSPPLAPEFCLLPNSKHLDLLLPESWRLQPTSRLLNLPSLNSLIPLLSPTPNCCFGVRRHCNNSRISAEPLVLPPGIPFVSSNRGSLQPQNSQIR